MNIKLATAREVHAIAVDLTEVHGDFWPALLFGGGRILHCDEGMVSRDEDGKPIGLASIAPCGESGSGDPEIVGVYVIPEERRKGVGLSLLRAAVGRCRERGLAEPSMVAACAAGKALIGKYTKG